MSTSNNQTQESSGPIKETEKKTVVEIVDRYYYAFLEFLTELGFSETDGHVPPELWVTIAQAFADTSGYRIVVQAEILEPIKAKTLVYRSVGRREVVSADLSLFVRPVGWEEAGDWYEAHGSKTHKSPWTRRGSLSASAKRILVASRDSRAASSPSSAMGSQLAPKD